MHMKLKAEIYIDKDEMRDNMHLHEFILKLLMKWEISGATTFTGTSGYGRHYRLKQPGREFSFDETPMLIVFIDDEEKVLNAIQSIRKEYQGGYIATYPVNAW